jgi:amino acid permease
MNIQDSQEQCDCDCPSVIMLGATDTSISKHLPNILILLLYLSSDSSQSFSAQRIIWVGASMCNPNPVTERLCQCGFPALLDNHLKLPYKLDIQVYVSISYVKMYEFLLFVIPFSRDFFFGC